MIRSESMGVQHFILISIAILSRARAETETSSLLWNQSMSDGEILISPDSTFAFGFFSPSNRSSNRYLGIWYHQIPVLTPVWVANRERPISDTSGVLSFADDGNLVITDHWGSIVQVSEVTSGAQASLTNNTFATISDDGNLVIAHIYNSNYTYLSYLWQSLDYPTDHFLPSMWLGVRGNTSMLVRSWNSSDNPSLGDFSMGADPNRGLQLMMDRGAHIYWESGSWDLDAEVFSSAPEITTNYGLQFQYSTDGDDQYFTYSGYSSIPARFMLDFNGRLNLLKWSESDQSWILLWSRGGPDCNVFNVCGYFGACSGNSLDACQCMKGFEPISMTDWRRGIWTGGCFRKNPLNCNSTSGGRADRFLAMPNTIFPRYGGEIDVKRDTECESACLNRCTCTAYAFTYTCLLWYDQLESIQQLHGDADASPGTLYVRLSASEFGENRNKRKWIVVIASIIFVSLCLILIGSFLRRRYRGRTKLDQEEAILLLGADIANKIGQNGSNGPDFTIFGFSHIAEATDNFSDTNKLGEGGFGPVYKGTLDGGHEIAVKRLSARSGQGLNEFRNEILLIAKLNHRNLVRLMGCCIRREEKILVYEYMPNKSLDFFLFGADKASQLDWSRRFHIIEGIAQGLLYLHKNTRPRIIHRDLKASNILLDAKMNPKISDFGMARIFAPNEIEANTIKVVGTFGNISPEYAAKGLFSIKSDVFSFGVLLLEIVSGKRNSSFHQHADYINLLGYAWQMWKDGKLFELIDPLLVDKTPTAEMLRCLHVGLLCVQESAIDRPNMAGVIVMLTSDNVTLPDPKPPGFFTLKTVAREDLSSNMCRNASLNMVTITEADGR